MPGATAAQDRKKEHRRGDMSIEVEVNLRIPRVKTPALDEKGYPIDNGSVRFTRLIQVPSIPKPGTSLQLTMGAGKIFECEVTRADWYDDRSLFVLSCKYANRSIPAEDCATLFSDPAWRVKPLL
jgi:hypothetical protein